MRERLKLIKEKTYIRRRTEQNLKRVKCDNRKANTREESLNINPANIEMNPF